MVWSSAMLLAISSSETFQNGAIVTKEGTGIAGKDGPAAMIMPSDPEVGDAYRTENTPGMALEEVTVKKDLPAASDAAGRLRATLRPMLQSTETTPVWERELANLPGPGERTKTGRADC